MSATKQSGLAAVYAAVHPPVGNYSDTREGSHHAPAAADTREGSGSGAARADTPRARLSAAVDRLIAKNFPTTAAQSVSRIAPRPAGSDTPHARLSAAVDRLIAQDDARQFARTAPVAGAEKRDSSPTAADAGTPRARLSAAVDRLIASQER
ncbi:hypothetical protein [Bradyrhizobium sp.]|uniref:hypothetical protein n=1 Tax=Bradyrhizobium sp. TaxID=376 RepID=UPI00261D03DC|nr:hypothetical protein [Bradyrhizobium sp.]